MPDHAFAATPMSRGQTPTARPWRSIAAWRSLPLLALLLLTSCASNEVTPVGTTVLSGFRGGTITTTHREAPGFGAVTPSTGLFAVAGAVGGALAYGATTSAGNAIVRDNAIADPAIEIGASIVSNLAEQDGLRIIDNAVRPDTGDVAKLSRDYASADLLVDVQTSVWQFMPLFDQSRYRIAYRASVQVIDTHRGAAIAQGSCAYEPEDSTKTAYYAQKANEAHGVKTVVAPSDAPTYDQLLMNGASRLRQELEKAATYCTNHFLVDMLGKGAGAASAPH